MAEKDPHNDWGLEDLRPLQDAINEDIRRLVDFYQPPVDRTFVDHYDEINQQAAEDEADAYMADTYPGWRQRFVVGISQQEIPAEGQE